jgi:hypothetical protein
MNFEDLLIRFRYNMQNKRSEDLSRHVRDNSLPFPTFHIYSLSQSIRSDFILLVCFLSALSAKFFHVNQFSARDTASADDREFNTRFMIYEDHEIKRKNAKTCQTFSPFSFHRDKKGGIYLSEARERSCCTLLYPTVYNYMWHMMRMRDSYQFILMKHLLSLSAKLLLISAFGK